MLPDQVLKESMFRETFKAAYMDELPTIETSIVHGSRAGKETGLFFLLDRGMFYGSKQVEAPNREFGNFRLGIYLFYKKNLKLSPFHKRFDQASTPSLTP